MVDRNRPRVIVESEGATYSLVADDCGELSIPLEPMEVGTGTRCQMTMGPSMAVTNHRIDYRPLVGPRDADAAASVITLQICRDGGVISVDFGSEEFLGRNVLPTLREKLAAILDDYHPEVLCFDLTRVRMVTAEMLGLFVSMHNQGVRAILLNPSKEVRYVARITNLDTLLEMTGSGQ